eukprot:2456743-Lingulodinium_polyedra.AAC.1
MCIRDSNKTCDELRVLGGTFGGDEVKRSAVREKLRSVRGMHSQLAHLGDAAVAMKLSRFCLGASKLQHLLRLYGEALQP